MIDTIDGMQSSGVQACAKHFLANEQELNRETMSSDVDDRTVHELYLWPFADAVKANVASVMCSYKYVQKSEYCLLALTSHSKYNGTYACENDKLLNGLLKKELGFPGYVLSDWNVCDIFSTMRNSTDKV
jgi:beta-glucosidase